MIYVATPILKTISSHVTYEDAVPLVCKPKAVEHDFNQKLQLT